MSVRRNRSTDQGARAVCVAPRPANRCATGATTGVAPRRSPGWWLQLVAAGHGGAGVILYRDALADIARARVVNAVPDRGDRATAFWFTAVTPLLWLGGRLLRSAESTGDLGAQRVAGKVLIAAGVVGSAAMPASGFWAVIAVGVSALRRSVIRR